MPPLLKGGFVYSKKRRHSWMSNRITSTQCLLIEQSTPLKLISNPSLSNSSNRPILIGVAFVYLPVFTKIYRFIHTAAYNKYEVILSVEVLFSI